MIRLIISIIVCQGVGFAGAFFTRRGIPEWYVFINKPWFTPPNQVFAPVWIVLYTLMGMAVFLIWRKGFSAPGVNRALSVFVLQLTLNLLWPVVFFGGHSVAGGFMVIVFLWCAVAGTLRVFWPVSKLSVVLLIPYMLWVSFAVVLNHAFIVLN